jgi:hypothetical protein
MYAVSELRDSTVTAFGIDEKSGVLKLLNTVPTKGGSACHLGLTRLEKRSWLRIMVGQQRGNFPRRPDGRLSESTSSATPDPVPTPRGSAVRTPTRWSFLPTTALPLYPILLDKFSVPLDPALAAMANDPPFVTVPAPQGISRFIQGVA